MALKSKRWIVAACLGCSMLATGLVSSGSRAPDDAVDSPEVLHLRRIQRRTFEAAQRLRSRTRADSVIATLPVLDARDSKSPRVVVDPLLPGPHRLMAERSVERQWRRLHIDSALVPVAVAVVLDTAAPRNGAPSSRRGEMAFDYALATRAEGSSDRCVVIVAIQMHQAARPGSQRILAARLDPSGSGDGVLGPCAFQARFGVPGAQVDAWLRGRSYDLALSPGWEEPEREGSSRLLAEEQGGTPAQIWAMARQQLSPDAQACVAGSLARCDSSLRPTVGARAPASGTLITRQLFREPHWGGLGRRYLSDLVTTVGADRFGRFWRSELPPDDALRAVAGMPLSAWTNQWAVSLVGEARTGPGLAARELFGAALLAAVCLALTAWGFGRRQVR